ncbi:unnamed protein product [Coffea canephora]|uniref:Uncharacterized protein n=1 Tax=Coffea canephora TaxID=49390 RepID=A0A068VAW5_COFCA|nr:unnamed protein product [Coffea canephora]
MKQKTWPSKSDTPHFTALPFTRKESDHPPQPPPLFLQIQYLRAHEEFYLFLVENPCPQQP